MNGTVISLDHVHEYLLCVGCSRLLTRRTVPRPFNVEKKKRD